MNHALSIALAFIIFLLGLRTACFWLQQWQIREYRWDRLRDHLWNTKEGTQKLFNLWFFPGFLPRPTVSLRVVIIVLTWIIISIVLLASIFQFSSSYFLLPTTYLLTLLFWERTIFLSLFLSVLLSKIPVAFQRRRIFRKAKSIIDKSDSLRIGIAGSFGKSSTKVILAHLLKSHFGEENVLVTPANENNELAVARLIVNNAQFFSSPLPKIFLAEIGTYRRGEIAKACEYFQPHYSAMIGINAQHISLFGSVHNAQLAEFEMAEASSKKAFFNAENELLNQIFEQKNIDAEKVRVVPNEIISNLETHATHSTFTWRGVEATLPWSGAFFVTNAVVALELAIDLGMKPESAAQALSKIPPPDRSLHVKKLKSGATLLLDPYSANPDGVRAAIAHLATFKGRKIFVSIPLIELGDESKTIHEQIFSSLKDIDADVFWLKNDFSDIGKTICGDRFHGANTELLKDSIQKLGTNDAILLESRLPTSLYNLVNS